MNAVCIRIDVDCTAVDGDIALIRFGGVALDAVAAGAAVVGVHRHRQSAVIGGIRVADADGVVAANAVICGVDGNAAVPDLQVVLADDAVASCLYTQIPESRINTELFNYHQKTE